LGVLYDYLNFVHEAYLHEVIGNDAYLDILVPFKGETSINRYENYIKSLSQ